MKKLNVTTQTVTDSQKATNASNASPRENFRIAYLFSKLQSRYGRLWIERIESDELLKIAKHDWLEALHGVTDEQIKHGLQNLQSQYPPQPYEFRGLCINKQSGLSHNTAAYKPFDRSKAIEHRGNPDLAKSAIADIKNLLKTGEAK